MHVRGAEADNGESEREASEQQTDAAVCGTHTELATELWVRVPTHRMRHKLPEPGVEEYSVNVIAYSKAISMRYNNNNDDRRYVW